MNKAAYPSFVQPVYEVLVNITPSRAAHPQYGHDSQVQSYSHEELFLQGHRLLLLEWNCFRDR
jgi:hypothetical protein